MYFKSGNLDVWCGLIIQCILCGYLPKIVLFVASQVADPGDLADVGTGRMVNGGGTSPLVAQVMFPQVMYMFLCSRNK